MYSCHSFFLSLDQHDLKLPVMQVPATCRQWKETVCPPSYPCHVGGRQTATELPTEARPLPPLHNVRRRSAQLVAPSALALGAGAQVTRGTPRFCSRNNSNVNRGLCRCYQVEDLRRISQWAPVMVTSVLQRESKSKVTDRRGKAGTRDSVAEVTATAEDCQQPQRVPANRRLDSGLVILMSDLRLPKLCENNLLFETTTCVLIKYRGHENLIQQILDLAQNIYMVYPKLRLSI